MQTAVQKKLHECKHGCGHKAARGPLNLHEMYHCLKLKEDKKPAGKKAPAKKQQNGFQKKCECTDGGTWAFLNSSIPAHAYWLSQGKKKYCTVCEEVI